MAEDIRASGDAMRAAIITAACDLHDELDRWPTPAEVAARIGVPVSTVRYHVKILEREGRIVRAINGHILQVPNYPPSQPFETPTDSPAVDLFDEE